MNYGVHYANNMNSHRISIRAICTILFTFTAYITAADISPNVSSSCSGTAVSVVVQSHKPFEGVISPRGATDSTCSQNGIGTNLLVLKLELNRKECGISYDKERDVYSLVVEVRNHPVLIVDDDLQIPITCPGTKTNTSLSHDSESLQLQVFEGNAENSSSIQQISEAYYSQPYSLVMRSNRYSLGPCEATAGNHSVQLTDPRGCSLLPSLLSDFALRDGVWTSRVPTMFRFPDSQLITFICHINPCDGICENIYCTSVEKASGLISSSIETRTLSVTLSVVDKNIVQNKNMSPPMEEENTMLTSQAESSKCPTDANNQLLRYLCIFLTICSTVGFLINILLCCILRRRRSREKPKLEIPAISTKHDFWIVDHDKQESGYLANQRQSTSYASVKHKPRRAQVPKMEYGMPTSRSSESSSDYRGDIYRRPEVRLSSTFMTPSTTVETDLDSSVSSANQASSYH